MTLYIVETDGCKSFSPDQVHVAPLANTDDVRALLLNLAAGQSVAPCQMPSTVLYYVIEGHGHLRVNDEQAELGTGAVAVVPAGATRAISAVVPTHVLAVQVL